MLGAAKPESRTCPVVLVRRVAASFAGFIGGALCADDGAARPLAVRRPARRGGRLRGAASSPTTASIPAGLASAPFDGEGTPRGRTALIEDGKLLAYLHDTYTARRGGAELDRQRRPRLATARRPRSAPRTWSSSPGELALERAARARPATASTSPRSPAFTRASTRSPAASRSAPRARRSAAASWPSRCASSRSPAICSAPWRRCRRSGSEARWVPFGGSVRTPPLLIGEMAIGGS